MWTAWQGRRLHPDLSYDGHPLLRYPLYTLYTPFIHPLLPHMHLYTPGYTCIYTIYTPNTSIHPLNVPFIPLHSDSSYDGHPLLSDWPSYIVQLPYYAAHSFNSDPVWQRLFASHWSADWAVRTRVYHSLLTYLFMPELLLYLYLCAYI